ncbi:MAG: hypothetical protein JWN23_1797 [Rhodocyclales bacterium]|nr:hypothetical protein [Rhodocyclales bacterium]
MTYWTVGRGKLIGAVLVQVALVIGAEAASSNKNKFEDNYSDPQIAIQFDELNAPINLMFKINYGKNNKICQQYYRMVSEAQYSRIPQCGRGDEITSKIWGMPKKIPLAKDQARYLVEQVNAAFATQLPKDEKYFTDLRNKSSSEYKSNIDVDTGSQSAPLIYSFSPLLDINNDGQLDQLVQWNDSKCGHARSAAPWTAMIYPSHLFVTDRDFLNMNLNDTKKTISRLHDDPRNWDYLGTQFGVYVFNNIAYFDTNVSAKLYFLRKSKREVQVDIKEENAFSLFLLNGRGLKPLCEIEWLPKHLNNPDRSIE